MNKQLEDIHATLTREDVPAMDRTENIGYNDATPVPEGQQRVDIGELLIAMKHAIEKMGKRNTHRGILVTAGAVLIHLIAENQLLQSKLAEAIEAGAKLEAAADNPLVQLIG